MRNGLAGFGVFLVVVIIGWLVGESMGMRTLGSGLWIFLLLALILGVGTSVGLSRRGRAGG